MYQTGGMSSLAPASSGNLKATSDFRGVYAALLEQWLGFDAERVLPKASAFARPTLVK